MRRSLFCSANMYFSENVVSATSAISALVRACSGLLLASCRDLGDFPSLHGLVGSPPPFNQSDLRPLEHVPSLLFSTENWSFLFFGHAKPGEHPSLRLFSRPDVFFPSDRGVHGLLIRNRFFPGFFSSDEIEGPWSGCAGGDPRPPLVWIFLFAKDNRALYFPPFAQVSQEHWADPLATVSHARGG